MFFFLSSDLLGLISFIHLVNTSEYLLRARHCAGPWGTEAARLGRESVLSVLMWVAQPVPV